ncbi:MAG: FtsX-like permease family protein [Nitriliruptorales bacterium]|nr:FtsX-like permease family protein [Nitriliruptorales bacterium]
MRPSTTATRWRSRMRSADVVATGVQGLRARKIRTALSAVGIAIGIASLIAVVGISASSRAELIAQIDRLGTNLLQVQAGDDVFGEDSALPEQAPSMVRRIAPVLQSAGMARLNTEVQRNDLVDDRNGLKVLAAEPQLLDTLEGAVAAGRFLDQGTAKLATVVLGSVAAERLGITDLGGSPRVHIAGEWFTVIGVLDPLPLNPEIDRSALIGEDITETLLGAEVIPTDIYLRVDPDHVDGVRAVLARTVNPADPNEVSVSRPSDALEARAQVDQNLQNLLLGLGGVALVVGGLGIANIMIVSVLERRTEIGIRRALGATKRHIVAQFVAESASLACLGGLLGAGLGTAITFGYATRQGWLVAVPFSALAAGVAAALVLGVLAGLYPAGRAAHLDPAEAVRPTG